MFNTIAAGTEFSLREQVKYEKDKAVKQPFIDQNGVKMLLVAIDHAELPDHPAPADALFIVMEGDGELTYEGKTVKVKHGTSVKFAKGAIHSVKADKLKFMLLFA
ncbi:cupin domain-containing protein [uncultured Faecalibaculum sp.]|uniref:cupin domain-containing protein n=1 Tax=uncultured Faecalibaculum sp. TaxID=1729681 RepID=UPI0025D88085|nr:cupin domain-containing protein [uncultured Faecalibaculum sp.]